MPQRQQLLNLVEGINETETIRSILRMVSPILGYNPRRLKQFVNLFRLRAHLANETGLFDTVAGLNAEETLTLEQLGKFVALVQMYPRLLFDLDDDRQLLKKLEFRAKKLGLPQPEDFTEAVLRWEQKTEILALLSYGLEDSSSPIAAQYSLERLNVDKLMQISPYVPRQNRDLDNINNEIAARADAEPADGTSVAPTPPASPSSASLSRFFKTLSDFDVSETSAPGQIVIPIMFREFFEPLPLTKDADDGGKGRQWDATFPVDFVDENFTRTVEARCIVYEPETEHPRSNTECRFTFRDRDILKRLSAVDILEFRQTGLTDPRFIVEKIPVSHQKNRTLRTAGRYGWL